MNVIKAAENMLTLVDKCEAPQLDGHKPLRSPDGMGISHALFLLDEVFRGRVTGEKAHRWLAWAQCILTYEGVIDLEACKYANLFS